jgi:hypothetical protein
MTRLKIANLAILALIIAAVIGYVFKPHNVAFTVDPDDPSLERTDTCGTSHGIPWCLMKPKAKD